MPKDLSIPLATFGVLEFRIVVDRLGASPRDRPFIAGNVAAASTVAMLPAQFRYSRAHAPRSSFSGSPSDTGLSFGFGRDILSTEVVEHTKLMQVLLKHESRTEAFERHNIVVKNAENGRICFHEFQAQQQGQQQDGHASHHIGYE